MLTAVSNVLGLIPIAPTVFWRPMAFAVMGGLIVATVLPLLLYAGALCAVVRH
jgi:multidrug efflux pump